MATLYSYLVLFLFFYCTGIVGLALNVSDIFLDASLGTCILDAPLKLIVSIVCD